MVVSSNSIRITKDHRLMRNNRTIRQAPLHHLLLDQAYQILSSRPKLPLTSWRGKSSMRLQNQKQLNTQYHGNAHLSNNKTLLLTSFAYPAGLLGVNIFISSQRAPHTSESNDYNVGISILQVIATNPKLKTKIYTYAAILPHEQHPQYFYKNAASNSQLRTPTIYILSHLPYTSSKRHTYIVHQCGHAF